MIWPPSVLRVQFYENGRSKKNNLWLPVFTIGPPVVLIALLLAPVAVPVLAGGRGAVVGGPVLFRLFCALRGFSFDAGSAGNGLRLAIY